MLHIYIYIYDISRLRVNVWCAVLDDQLTGPFILEVRLTREAYFRCLREEFPRISDDVPLNKRGRMYLQHDGAPHSSREVRNFLTIVSLGNGSDVAVPTIGQPGLRT